VVLLNSLKENDLIKDEEDKVKKKDTAQIRKDMVMNVIGGLQWLFGWLPKSQVAKIEDIKDFVLPRQDSDDEA